MQRKFKFFHIDVFARRPLEGNSLAVFPDARGLSNSDLQAIARETNLSETTFVFPRDKAVEDSRGIRVRIFTTKEELPFAGHPTLGTSWILRGEREEVVLDLNVGSIPVRFTKQDQGLFGEMRQNDPVWGNMHDSHKVASALRINESDIDLEKPIQTVSTGNPFAIVCFNSLEKLKSLRPNGALMESYLKTTDARFFYLVCSETENNEARLHARMMFYGGEDPATGSAAGPAAAWMLRHKLIQPEELVWIEQGVEILRPSQIFVKAGGTADAPKQIRVGGYCYGLIEGELDLPNEAT
jgi:trans-2,3-dihydro-3-hydroxyanthranilate isomerase